MPDCPLQTSRNHFDQAYQITNGVVTTNTTGVLSPYGSFFATQPGPTALVTMPDPDTGARGTCTVYAVSLNLDANHDGTMDLSFNGADATSQASPMECWVNNDHDWSSYAGDPGEDVESTTNYADYTFQNIPSQRDLEDWSRLWICGMPALTNGYQVTLSWANGSSGNPAVNLVNAVEADGGIGYLTNADIAAEQTAGSTASDPSYKFARITPGQSYTFPDNYFTNNANKYFLFEGAGIGEGQLTLTIADANGNTIAQTGVWLDLHDIKDFYERAVITNITSGAISNWSSTIESVQQATTSALGSDTNLIVFVHGFNVGPWDWLDDSDTVFKRLYWAGYNGKFATVDWPDEPLTFWNDITENTSIFNNSEIKAYKAGSALADYLSQLRTRFPNCQLNVLAHSQGNAVMGEAIEEGAPFDNYIMTQAAMPASSYDVNAPVDSTLQSWENTLAETPEWQPMGYHGVYTNMATLPGKIVSFYNPEDYVLGIWQTDQGAGKPNGYARSLIIPFSPYYFYDGANGWYDNGFLTSYLVTDPQESRSMVSRSRTDAAGRQDTGGVIESTIDLNAQFGFSDTTAEHSAEWTRPIQTSYLYYKQILLQIQPTP